MRIEIPCNPCVVDEKVDVSMAGFDLLNNGKQTCAICNIALQGDDIAVALKLKVTMCIDLSEYEIAYVIFSCRFLDNFQATTDYIYYRAIALKCSCHHQPNS